MASRALPKDIVEKEVRKIYHGPCPECNGRGPVDVHVAYQIYSILVLSSWKSIPKVCCRSCGRKHQIGGFVYSLVFGWWGFPWGFFMTPVQIGRNIIGMLKESGNNKPSEELENIIRLHIASHINEDVEPR